MRPSLARAVALMLIVGAPAVVPHAQRPERQHDVLVPGLGVRLREGWRMSFHDGCRYAVPSAWRQSPDRSEAFAPDGSTVSLWAIQISNWSQYKSRLKAAYTAGAHGYVRNETDSQLWIESPDRIWVEHLVTVMDGRAACAALLELRKDGAYSDDTISGIVESVGGGTPAWPADQR